MNIFAISMNRPSQKKEIFMKLNSKNLIVFKKLRID